MCFRYLQRNFCPQLVGTTLLRWRAEKSLKHYSRSLLACQLAAVNGPTGRRLDIYSHRSSLLPGRWRLQELTEEQIDRQTDSQRDAQTGGQTERLPDNCDDVSRNFASLKRERENLRQVPQFSDSVIYHSFSVELEKLYLFAGRWFQTVALFRAFFISLNWQKKRENNKLL